MSITSVIQLLTKNRNGQDLVRVITSQLDNTIVNIDCSQDTQCTTIFARQDLDAVILERCNSLEVLSSDLEHHIISSNEHRRNDDNALFRGIWIVRAD